LDYLDLRDLKAESVDQRSLFDTAIEEKSRLVTNIASLESNYQKAIHENEKSREGKESYFT
jgi:hypothetical protein